MEILGILIGSGLLLAAASTVWRWLRRPRLRVYFDPEKTGQVVRTEITGRESSRAVTAGGHSKIIHPPGVWYHLQVANDGHRLASECKAYIDSLERYVDDEWMRLAQFHASIPLVWANTGAQQVVDVHPKRTIRLDIGCALQDEDFFRFHSGLGAAGLIDRLTIGRYRLRVTVLSKNANLASVRLVLEYGGDSSSLTVSAEA